MRPLKINPVRNSSGALNLAAEQRGIISNGVKSITSINGALFHSASINEGL